jgi:hypothetical protein
VAPLPDQASLGLQLRLLCQKVFLGIGPVRFCSLLDFLEVVKSCFPSYADFRSRANTAMWLDLGHMIKGEHTREVGG